MLYVKSYKVLQHQLSAVHLVDVVLPQKIRKIKKVAVYAVCGNEEQATQLGTYSVSVNQNDILLSIQKLNNVSKIEKHSLNHMFVALGEDYAVRATDNMRVVVSEVLQHKEQRQNYPEYTIKIILEYD